jgi:hypothetical protein
VTSTCIATADRMVRLRVLEIDSIGYTDECSVSRVVLVPAHLCKSPAKALSVSLLWPMAKLTSRSVLYGIHCAGRLN